VAINDPIITKLRFPIILVAFGTGAIAGALKYVPDGVIGGALMGLLVALCGNYILTDPTRVWRYVRACGFSMCCFGAISGVRQGGVEGAAVLAFVGGIIGSMVGLLFGIVMGSAFWLRKWKDSHRTQTF
jgi:hypothetical protein